MDKSNRVLDLFPDHPVKPAKEMPKKETDPDPEVSSCPACGSLNLNSVTIEDKSGKKITTDHCKLCWYEGEARKVRASEIINRLTGKDVK